MEAAESDAKWAAERLLERKLKWFRKVSNSHRVNIVVSIQVTS
jgi:hypothetical protein